MKLRPLAAGAALAAVALLGSACGKDDPATPNAGSSSTVEEQVVDARAEVKAALEKSAQQSALKMSVEMTGMTIDAHVDTTAKTSLMHMVTEGDGQKMEMEMLTIDAITYIKYVSGGIADQVKGKWVKVDAATLGQDELFTEDLFDAEEMLKEGVTVTKVTDGQYKIELGAGEGPDVGGLFGGLTGGDETPDAGASAGPTTVLVDVNADGLVTAFTSEGAEPGQSATVTFSDYGTPLKVEKPADKDIVEG
ncbi:MAG TPA: hypothetical protein VGF17_30870 [Phytomonospora sp.]